VPELAPFNRWSAALTGLIVLQYCLGVTTLLTHVRTYIAVTHQLTALIIVGVLLTLLHQVLQSGPRPYTPAEDASARSVWPMAAQQMNHRARG
jgi:heme A synthase